ncbi:hypothetical protein I8751_28020 [Nostocaceae cyanobacterium CENA357]|uniref:Uncharacterized protein n=1 Tax=Atlanticothrix silvestris CENA357 TaxID=1725252 RepID=A0A8J7L8G3_9CYAN|nr:hypothetical protein [Atlanticothrix silvestris]MBH8556117.1 hypothetical protein [Atlanticothrix silvestris CENA357]
MSLVLTKYYYNNESIGTRQEVRVYCQKQGANGRIVLEDIISALLTNITFSIKKKSIPASIDNNILLITKEKIEKAKINPFIHEGLHLADVEQLYEFYHFCNDISDAEFYKIFGNWLNLEVCSLIIKRLAHLGNLVNPLPFEEKYSLRITKLFKDKEKVTIVEWLTTNYGLTVPWVITILIQKVKILILGGFQINTEAPSTKNQTNVNIYSLNTFRFIAQAIEWLFSGSDNWNWLKESLSHDFVQKAVDADKQLIKSLRENGKNDDDIIQIIWMVTPTSNLIENKNYQYQILKAFLAMV